MDLRGRSASKRQLDNPKSSAAKRSTKSSAAKRSINASSTACGVVPMFNMLQLLKYRDVMLANWVDDNIDCKYNLKDIIGHYKADIVECGPANI